MGNVPSNNQSLGRGELHFARYASDTQTPGGERYLGNSPAFGLSIAAAALDHYSSDHGIKEKNKSIALQTDRSGSFTLDDIQMDSLALFFFGAADVVSQASATGHSETFNDVGSGMSYQLGTTDATPAGVRGVASVVVTDGADEDPVTYVAGTDYAVDLDRARITVLDGGAIEDVMKATYNVSAKSIDRVISGGTPIEGTLRFIAFNPQGADIDYFMPYVKLSPNGDFALKGDDWQTIPFTVEILKKGSLEAIYLNGLPYTP